MKTTVLFHLFWALFAVATFVFGWTLQSENQDGQANSRHGGSGRSARVGEKAAGKLTSSRRGSVRSGVRSRRDDGPPDSLTSGDIRELGRLFREGNLVERRLAFAEMLKNLTPENALELRKEIADLPQDSPEFREFHFAWGAVAGNEAVSHGKETPKKDMAAALAGWASADPSAALAFFDTLSPEEQNNAAHMKWGAVFGLADADPGLAADFIIRRERQGDRDASKMIRVAAATALKKGDRQEATEWVQTIPEGPLQNNALQHLAGEFAKEAPTEAVAWALALPVGEGQSHAVGTSFHHWANRDPEKAAEAIASLPSPQQDAATFGYATSVVHKEPAIGVQWAATISDPESRKRALVDTGRVFYRRDREAAREWLASSGLPEGTVQEITAGK